MFIIRIFRLHFIRLRFFYAGVFLGILLLYAGYLFIVRPPQGFPENTVVSIPNGSSARDVGDILYQHKVIAHPELFLIFLSLSGNDSNIKSGDYIFSEILPLPNVIARITSGNFGSVYVKVVIPEGVRVKDISLIVEKALPHLNARVFESFARQHEGYLFPDTYNFLPGSTYQEVIKTMRARFDEILLSIETEVAQSKEPLSRIVTMASLLEREARQLETMRVISGILWRRISIGMPLQVDAVFGYIFDRPTYSPSFEDLKVESPYNTYTNKDLPPGPIGNPGLNALRAAVTPIKTTYLYYLSDPQGLMHYANTFEEHKKNRALYLR